MAVAGCSDGVSSEEDAKAAYVGLDASLDKALTLGLQGFNEAQSANIAAQSAQGAKSGTLTVTGKVDQGASANKTMNLVAAMTDYSDNGSITYASAGASLDMSLKGIPDGTLSGQLVGDCTMTGDLEGTVHLALSFEGRLQPTMADATKIERKPGSTRITGAATTGDATYAVDVTR